MACHKSPEAPGYGENFVFSSWWYWMISGDMKQPSKHTNLCTAPSLWLVRVCWSCCSSSLIKDDALRPVGDSAWKHDETRILGKSPFVVKWNKVNRVMFWIESLRRRPYKAIFEKKTYACGVDSELPAPGWVVCVNSLSSDHPSTGHSRHLGWDVDARLTSWSGKW